MRRPRFWLRVRELMLLVACCAVGCWAFLEYRNAGPITDAARRLRSRDAEARRAAALELGVQMSDALPALPALVAATRDPDAEVRRAAAESIGVIARKGPKAGPEEDAAVRALVAALGDPDPKARESAATALGLIASPVAAPALAVCLGDRDPAVRRAAAGALGALGPDARSGAPALLRAIAAEADPSDRARLLEILPRLDPDPAVALPPLTSRLARDGDALPRAATARALGEVLAARLKAGEVPPATTPAVTALRDAISDRSPRVRQEAVAALGRVRAAARGPIVPMLDAILVAALAHRRADVRAATAGLYGPRSSPAVKPPPFTDDVVRALGAALGAREAEVRRQAASALQSVASPRPPAGSKLHGAVVDILPALRIALREHDPAIHNAAFFILTRLSDGAPATDREIREAARAAAREFAAWLSDPREGVRYDAANVLLQTDPRDADLVLGPLRAAAAHDRSERVRKDATFIARRIEEERARKLLPVLP